MAVRTYLQAISDGLREEMRRDQRVFLIGEDIGAFGGAFKVTQGFQEEFGEWRVIDAPLSEVAIVGGCTGAALVGMRPVAEMQFSDFVSVAWDQLVTVAAKQHYRAGTPVPFVVRCPSGGGFSGGPFHSQNPESSFAHIPGLKVVCPSTPADAKGLLATAIADPNPVLYFEHKYLYRRLKDEVPDERYAIPFGEARIHRGGGDATVVTWGAMVHTADEAAESLAAEGLSIEIVDLRTLIPWIVLPCSPLPARRRKYSSSTRTREPEGLVQRSLPPLPRKRSRISTPRSGASRRLTRRYPFRRPSRSASSRRSRTWSRACASWLRTELTPGGTLMATGTAVDVVMPQMGVSVSEGTITRWLKSEGDPVAADEPLLEISTDKVDTEVPAPASGILGPITVQEGETVEVGTTIATILPEGSEERPRHRRLPLPRRLRQRRAPRRLRRVPSRPSSRPNPRRPSPSRPQLPMTDPARGERSSLLSLPGSPRSTTSTCPRSRARAGAGA